jgi:membrane protein CcdC involved in cytochrome C biogenesis
MRSQLKHVDIFAFLPLALFLAVAKYHTAEFPVRWAYAFLYTFVPALIFCVVGLLSFRQCTQLWLGTNLWFALLGLFAVSCT